MQHSEISDCAPARSMCFRTSRTPPATRSRCRSRPAIHHREASGQSRSEGPLHSHDHRDLSRTRKVQLTSLGSRRVKGAGFSRGLYNGVLLRALFTVPAGLAWSMNGMHREADLADGILNRSRPRWSGRGSSSRSAFSSRLQLTIGPDVRLRRIRVNLYPVRQQMRRRP